MLKDHPRIRVALYLLAIAAAAAAPFIAVYAPELGAAAATAAGVLTAAAGATALSNLTPSDE